jgi:hypothetical protein
MINKCKSILFVKKTWFEKNLWATPHIIIAGYSLPTKVLVDFLGR